MTLNYDVAIALSEGCLNKFIYQVYKQKRAAQFFSGMFEQKVNLQYIGKVDVKATWRITQSPSFDLSPNNPAQVAYRTDTLNAISNSGALSSTRKILTNFCSRFQVNLKTNLSIGLSGNVLSLSPSIAANCEIVRESNNGISIKVVSMVAIVLKDKTIEKIINDYLLPLISAGLSSLLSGISIPSFTLEGVKLSSPMPVIYNKYIVVYSQILSSGGKSALLDSIPVKNDFVALISPRGLQEASVVGMKEFTSQYADKLHGRGSGKKGKRPFNVGAKYHYDLKFGRPSAKLSGKSIKAAIDVTGSAGAAVTLTILPDIGVSYKAYTRPKPSLTFNVALNKRRLMVKVHKVAPFTVLLSLTGKNPVKWILSALAEIVVQPIIAVVTPIISQCFNKMKFSVWKCPEITVSVEGIYITFRPSKVKQSTYNGAILLKGQLIN